MKFLFRSISVFILLSGNLINAQSLPKFSGLMFGDFFYNASQNNPADNDLNGFQFRRIYATADYSINENFYTRFRLETDQTTNSNTPANKLGVMVKDAWLQWKNVFDGSNLFFGISPTPAFEVAEGIWENRFLEKTMLDYWGVVSSRDFGIDLKGNIQNDGSIKYWFKVGNNSGNAPENNKHKRFYGLVEFHPANNITITAYGDFASSAKVYDGIVLTDKSTNSFVTALFAGYKGNDFSVGAEVFYRNKQNSFRKNNFSALENLNSHGFSFWSNYRINNNLKIVGRYDMFEPNTKLDNDGNSFILLALDYVPADKIHLSPNVEIKTYQSGGEEDIVPRLTFFWEF